MFHVNCRPIENFISQGFFASCAILLLMLSKFSKFILQLNSNVFAFLVMFNIKLN